MAGIRSPQKRRRSVTVRNRCEFFVSNAEPINAAIVARRPLPITAASARDTGRSGFSSSSWPGRGAGSSSTSAKVPLPTFVPPGFPGEIMARAAPCRTGGRRLLRSGFGPRIAQAEPAEQRAR